MSAERKGGEERRRRALLPEPRDCRLGCVCQGLDAALAWTYGRRRDAQSCQEEGLPHQRPLWPTVEVQLRPGEGRGLPRGPGGSLVVVNMRSPAARPTSLIAGLRTAPPRPRGSCTL